MHLCIVLSCSTQYINNLADGIVVRIIRPFNNLYHSLLAVTAFLEAGDRNENIAIRFVRSDQIGEPSLDLKCTYKSIFGALENISDLTFKAGMRTTGEKHHPHTISVHGSRRVTLSNKDRITSIVGYQIVFTAYPAL